jgi:hypothetical protein
VAGVCRQAGAADWSQTQTLLQEGKHVHLSPSQYKPPQAGLLDCTSRFAELAEGAAAVALGLLAGPHNVKCTHVQRPGESKQLKSFCVHTHTASVKPKHNFNGYSVHNCLHMSVKTAPAAVMTRAVCCVLCCVLQGIPTVHRGWVWWRLSGAADAAAADPGHYQACLAAGSSSAAVKQVCEDATAVIVVLPPN